MYFKTTNFNGKVEQRPSKVMHRTRSFKSNHSIKTMNRRRNCSKNSSALKLDTENEEDLHLFLEDERRAQQEFLDEPIKIDDLIGSHIDKSNLTNVLNNHLINKKAFSAKKSNSNIFPLDLFENERVNIENNARAKITLESLEQTNETSNESKNKLNSTIKFSIDDLKVDEEDPKPQILPKDAIQCEPKVTITKYMKSRTKLENITPSNTLATTTKFLAENKLNFISSPNQNSKVKRIEINKPHNIVSSVIKEYKLTKSRENPSDFKKNSKSFVSNPTEIKEESRKMVK